MQSLHQPRSREQGHGGKALPCLHWWCGGGGFGPVPVSPCLLHCCSLGKGKLINAGSPATDFSQWKCDSGAFPRGELPTGQPVLGAFGSVKPWALSSALGGLSPLRVVVASVANNCPCNNKTFPKPSIRVIRGLRPRRGWGPPPAMCSRASPSVSTPPTSGWILRNHYDGDYHGHLIFQGRRSGPRKQLAPLQTFTMVGWKLTTKLSDFCLKIQAAISLYVSN